MTNVTLIATLAQALPIQEMQDTISLPDSKNMEAFSCHFVREVIILLVVETN